MVVVVVAMMMMLAMVVVVVAQNFDVYFGCVRVFIYSLHFICVKAKNVVLQPEIVVCLPDVSVLCTIR